MKETIEELLGNYVRLNNLYASCHEEVCEQCDKDLVRMSEIIKEITTKIEENVLREVMKLSENQEAEDGFGNYYPVITLFTF